MKIIKSALLSVAVLSGLVFTACTKELGSANPPQAPNGNDTLDNDSFTACDYLGFQVGSAAVYTIAGFGDFTTTCTKKEIIDGLEWFTLTNSIDSTIPNHIRCGADYIYQIGYWMIDDTSLAYTTRILNSNAKVGDSWTDNFTKTVTLNGFEHNIYQQYIATVKKVNDTKTVNGKTYKNVIQVDTKETTCHSINGFPGDTIVALESNWYAPNFFGILNESDGSSTTLKSFKK